MEADPLGELIERQQHLNNRANCIFASKIHRSASKIEKAVFDYLVARLVLCYGYSGISDAMLTNASHDALEIVGYRSRRASARKMASAPLTKPSLTRQRTVPPDMFE